MKIAVVARDSEDQEEYSYRVKKRFKLVKKKPEIVLVVGGDGTLLIAERLFPGVPKVQLKNSSIGNTYPQYDHPVDEIFEKLAEKKYEITEHDKLQAQWFRKGKKKGEFLCTNDFSIRNQLLIQALRFTLTINDEHVPKDELVGDGVVICTPFGSTAYYESITKKSFDDGVGIALNNCNTKERGIHTTRDKTIKITITRMPADFAIDNDPDIHALEAGDEIIITASGEKMKRIVLT